MTRVDVVALALQVRPAGAANVGAFLPVDPEPLEAVVNGGEGFGGVAGGIGVLDTEDEGALVMASEQPVKQGGAGSSDVEVTGGGWGEANANRRSHDPCAWLRCAPDANRNRRESALMGRKRRKRRPRVMANGRPRAV